MGHFSMKISAPTGSILGGTQHFGFLRRWFERLGIRQRLLLPIPPQPRRGPDIDPVNPVILGKRCSAAILPIRNGM